jgi:hypothetical protein
MPTPSLTAKTRELLSLRTIPVMAECRREAARYATYEKVGSRSVKLARLCGGSLRTTTPRDPYQTRHHGAKDAEELRRRDPSLRSCRL